MYFLNNSNKMFFTFILFFSTLIAISSNSWFGCWIGLEINLLSFIPLISSPFNLLASEASLKYFLIQSIASINFLFVILLKMTFFKNFLMDNFFSIMISSSMLMKMGSAPFHFWFPNIVEGLSWFNNFILMTWQKITPMILLSYYFNKNFLYTMIIFNIIIGAIGGLNQISLRKLMAFSSINNLGWMLFAIMISENLWIFYFTMYSFLISIMCFFFFNLNMFFINQLFINNISPLIKINLLINFLSLGGLPPFLGFFPKWIMINFLMNNKFYLLTFLFVMMSLIIIFFYIRITYTCLMLNYFKMKWLKISLKNNFLWLMNFFSLISIMGMILSTFLFL
uniref:NADH-ubiquinone oxidoreductase chain 2 n=2 Tax=Antheraea TaxID=7118 RepID=Q85MV8_ANTPE|nr:NADH dehydrogenase subunit 2 [Antheraea pernyi]YP_009693823.1 NADH dehydrogenase subunit 2 [Antheraea pernyi x Antherea roylei]AAO53273.1 NADH dehydrogenase subunit 2 [Antheraea pernyi]QEI03759.1 NADH dehydrogenase subunit 2 [Antheraea pernyi x Antherea roylei]QOJ46173.1 NADH dehydrogenase subunit 2 [Antheraea pernyi]QPP20654.1 NADH dehydrogenase subunit 2 [Antheraea pernyi]QZJ45833.1 NADH dehydrogenase subunit 2 [Antheraea pernyi]